MHERRQKKEGRRKIAARHCLRFFICLLPFAFCLRAAAQQKATSEFIGTEECRGCHHPVCKNFEATPHFKTTLKRGALVAPTLAHDVEGCETSHGPGRAHADSLGDPKKIIGFAKMTRAEITRRCLDCHQYTEEHGNFRR